MHISIFSEAYGPPKIMSSDRRWGVENLFFRQQLEEKEKCFTALEVSSFSTQRKWTVEKRNKTSKISSSFCTKKHQNPFSSLGERVVWSCVGGFKKVPKTKTHTSRLHGGMYSLRLLIESIHTWSTCFRFWDVFETIHATSNNSFSKTTKWILLFFGAKWRRGFACFVPFLYWSLLLSWKRRKVRLK